MRSFSPKYVIDAGYVDIVYALRRIIGAKIRDVWRRARDVWRRIELDQLQCNRIQLIRRQNVQLPVVDRLLSGIWIYHGC